jgi:hypothetical protein
MKETFKTKRHTAGAVAWQGRLRDTQKVTQTRA